MYFYIAAVKTLFNDLESGALLILLQSPRHNVLPKLQRIWISEASSAAVVGQERQSCCIKNPVTCCNNRRTLKQIGRTSVE